MASDHAFSSIVEPMAKIDSRTEKEYSIQILTSDYDPVWDRFVEKAEGGSHVQTSEWAQAKAILGWKAVRVTIWQNSDIVAGAQILMRRIPIIGIVGHIHRGPLGISGSGELTSLLLGEIEKTAKQYKVSTLFVQPPYGAENLASQLPKKGFRKCHIALAYTSTVLVDISEDEEILWKRLRRTLRQDIKRGERGGIHIREGKEQDLPCFYNLLKATCSKHGIHPEPEEFFEKLWQISYPSGHVRIFLAEMKGEILSALLVIPFGDTLTLKRIGWNGRQKKLSPSKTLYWEVFKWAKSNRYRYCDFDGLTSAVANRVCEDGNLTEEIKQTPDFLKLSYGGRVVNIPGVYENTYDPVRRWILRRPLALLAKNSWIQDQITNCWFWLKSRKPKSCDE